MRTLAVYPVAPSASSFRVNRPRFLLLNGGIGEPLNVGADGAGLGVGRAPRIQPPRATVS